MTKEIEIIGTTQSGKPIQTPYSMGYGKIRFDDGNILAGNFKEFSRNDHNEAAEINKQYGLNLMNSFRSDISELLNQDLEKPVFNPTRAPQYTTKDCFTEKDFHSFSNTQIAEITTYIQDNGYEGKIQGAFYMYYYHTRKSLML